VNDAAELLLAALMGAALGSIPFAWLLVRWRTGRDVAGTGSGNVGALNASRVAGSPWLGVAVLGLDLAKGVAAALVARALFRVPHAELFAGVGCVAGHDYNPWLSIARGKIVGGKGFATAAGFFLATMPWCVAIWFALLIPSYAVLLWTIGMRDEAPSSFLATLLLPVPAALLYGPAAAAATVAVAILILPKHVADLRGLFGPEAKAPGYDLPVRVPPPDRGGSS